MAAIVNATPIAPWVCTASEVAAKQNVPPMVTVSTVSTATAEANVRLARKLPPRSNLSPKRMPL